MPIGHPAAAELVNVCHVMDKAMGAPGNCSQTIPRKVVGCGNRHIEISTRKLRYRLVVIVPRRVRRESRNIELEAGHGVITQPGSASGSPLEQPDGSGRAALTSDREAHGAVSPRGRLLAWFETEIDEMAVAAQQLQDALRTAEQGRTVITDECSRSDRRLLRHRLASREDRTDLEDAKRGPIRQVRDHGLQ